MLGCRGGCALAPSGYLGTMTDITSGALRALLREIVDYAGLFPPAGLDMSEAVRRFAGHRDGEQAWMLGRFVVPAARLDEFIAAASPILRAAQASHAAPWHLTALVGPDTEADVTRVLHFGDGMARDGAIVDAVEVRAVSPAGVAALASVLPRGLHAYVEIPVAEDPEPLLAAVKAANLRAKIRTGGVRPELIPQPAQVARFLTGCARHDLAFKATAGLHHPLRADYPLTYEPGCDSATMFGFLNVFMAAALAHEGEPEATVHAALTDGDRTAFRFSDTAAHWRDCSISTERLAHIRATFATSFGSCSFNEPVEELAAL